MSLASWMSRRALLIVPATCGIVGASLAPTLLAEAPTPSSQAASPQTSSASAGSPVFRASTELVQFEVIVVDRDGRPVRDLPLADFEVKQGGKVQTLRFAEFVNGDAAAGAPSVAELGHFQQRARRLGDLANRSGVVIYGIHTAPFSSGVLMPEVRGTDFIVRGSVVTGGHGVYNMVSNYLRIIAENTGGAARRLNDIDTLLEWATDESASYYVLAYEPPPGAFDGKGMTYRSLDVRVHRDGVKVRSRAGFYNVTDDALRHQP
jgi:hypothetical protein